MRYTLRAASLAQTQASPKSARARWVGARQRQRQLLRRQQPGACCGVQEKGAGRRTASLAARRREFPGECKGKGGLCVWVGGWVGGWGGGVLAAARACLAAATSPAACPSLCRCCCPTRFTSPPPPPAGVEGGGRGSGCGGRAADVQGHPFGHRTGRPGRRRHARRLWNPLSARCCDRSASQGLTVSCKSVCTIHRQAGGHGMQAGRQQAKVSGQECVPPSAAFDSCWQSRRLGRYVDREASRKGRQAYWSCCGAVQIQRYRRHCHGAGSAGRRPSTVRATCALPTAPAPTLIDLSYHILMTMREPITGGTRSNRGKAGFVVRYAPLGTLPRSEMTRPAPRPPLPACSLC